MIQTLNSALRMTCRICHIFSVKIYGKSCTSFLEKIYSIWNMWMPKAHLRCLFAAYNVYWLPCHKLKWRKYARLCDGLAQIVWPTLWYQDICFPLGQCKESVRGLWNTVEISTGHMNPSPLQLRHSQPIFRLADRKVVNSNHLEVMPYTRTVLVSPS